MTAAIDWTLAYDDLIARLPEYVRNARLTLCGFSACVDVYLSLHDIDGAAAAAEGTPAKRLFAELKRRALAGVGGEVKIEWPEGPLWMARHLQGRLGLGGTSAQAAHLLATLGAPALLSLADRNSDQLSVIHPNIYLATDHGVERRREIEPEGSRSIPHYIFEYTAGRAIDGQVLPRSSRVIVRFGDSNLEHDNDFERWSIDLASSAGSGIICGFNELPPARTGAEYAYATRIAEAWRAQGLGIVHLELGDFPTDAMRDEALNMLAPAATSFGASLSELSGLLPGGDLVEERAIRLAEMFGFARVCIHADRWALAITRGDPKIEMTALEMGCLVASARAKAGNFTFPREIPRDSELVSPPFPPFCSKKGWEIVCCPAPYLARPTATIGLGDTFLAGTLLVLGAAMANPHENDFSFPST